MAKGGQEEHRGISGFRISDEGCRIVHVGTEEQHADVLTKPLWRKKFLVHRAALMTRVEGLSITCATVEHLPQSIVGDDNISVPVVAWHIRRLLSGSPACGGGGV